MDEEAKPTTTDAERSKALEDELEPVQRDGRFIVRLVLLILVSVIAAAFVGMKLKGAAASCGSNVIRPGSTVIPP